MAVWTLFSSCVVLCCVVLCCVVLWCVVVLCVCVSEGYFCPAGSSSGATNACPGGTYGPSEGLSSVDQCRACPAGYFCPAASAASSVKICGGSRVWCPANSALPAFIGAGAYGINGADPDRPSDSFTDKTGCEVGYYCDGIGFRAQCPPGTFSSSSASACTACQDGYVATQSGQEACDPCPAGSTSNADKTVCEPCPPGRYTSYLTANPECLACPPGTASNETGYFLSGRQSSCPLCEAGKFTTVAGRDFCSDCIIGSYTPSLGTTRCSVCPVGAVCPSEGMSTPLLCPAGTFNTFTNRGNVSADCAKCPAGYW
jgi:hypothetical protein